MSVVEEYLRYSVSARSFLRFGSPLGITVQVNIDVLYAKLLHFILGPHAKGAARDREYNDSSFHVRWKREDRVKRKFAAVTNCTGTPSVGCSAQTYHPLFGSAPGRSRFSLFSLLFLLLVIHDGWTN